MTLLEQLKAELPDHFHRRRVYYPSDVAEAEKIAERARQLLPRTVRYLLVLQRFEDRPVEGDPKRAAFDVLIAALDEVAPRLSSRAAVENPMDGW